MSRDLPGQPRLLCASASLVALAAIAAACAARQAEPEIVGVDYETRVSVNGAPAAPDGEPAAAQPRGPGPGFDPEPTLRVVDVRGAGDASGARVVVQLSRAPSAVRPFALDGPPRCVVDVDGPAVASRVQQSLATGDPLVPRVRVGSYADRVRVVAELGPGAPQPCHSGLDGTAIVVGVGARPTGAPPAVVWTSSTAPDGATAHAAFVLAASTGAPAPVASGPSTTGESPVAAASAPASSAPADDLAPPPALGSRVPERGGPGRVASAPPVPGPSGPEAVAPPEPAPGAQRYSGRRISLEFKDADILNVLRIIADVAQKNIVATDDVKGRVTIVLRDVPWDHALDILLKSTGLEQVEYDDVITVSTSTRLEQERKSRLAAQQAGRELEPLHTEYIRVNYVKASELANILQGGASTSGAAAVAAQTIGQQTALDSSSQRRGLLSSRGSAQVNEATNTLIVRDIADGIANARELARKLDVQTPQVAIQGLIFEGDTNLDRSLGIRWGAHYIASPETGNPTGKDFPGRIAVGGAGPATALNPDGSVAPILVDFPAALVGPGHGSTLGLLLGSLSGQASLDAQITALEEAGRGKVISRPKVITLNNAEAEIQSLEILRVRLPSTGTVISTGAGGTAGAQTAATQAIDTGIILRVTPQVSSDGYVLMQLFVKSSVPSETKTDDIPNEISRQATSQVLVREGETVVIGGVYRQRANKLQSGLPWLGSIPVLGWLFKSTLERDNRQELLVFITPRVVWRPAGPEALPSASELWEKRKLSAYPLEPGAGRPVPQPGSEG